MKFSINGIIKFIRRNTVSKQSKNRVEEEANLHTESSIDTTVLEEIILAPEVKLSRYMIGTYIDSTNGEWMLSYVKFDPVTKALGEVKTERIAGDEEVMRERLVIKQGQLGLLERGEASDTVKTDIY